MNSFRVSDRVQEEQIGSCSLIQLPVTVPQVVRWHGSIASNPDLECGGELMQVVVASLMDKGTRRRDRFAISDALERRGARISISSAGVRLEFRGQAMTDDMPDVMALTAEVLREPLLDEAEFEKVKGRVQASVEQARDSTGMQAEGALARRLFGKGHPSYVFDIDELLESLASLSVDMAHRWYERHVGASDLVLTVTGDLGPEESASAVATAFADWNPHSAEPTDQVKACPADPGIEHINMDEKPALDVRLGHALPVSRTDPDWLPLHVGAFMLGGNFSARLMRTIRDEMGLTYGIFARLQGMHGRAQGFFSTGLTLGLENLERGIDETLGMIRTYVEEGCTEEELRDTKTTLAGAYQVSLSTTGALAAQLHKNRVQGFPVEAIDTFVDEVQQLSVEAVNSAIARQIKPADLHTVIAGTLPG